MAHARQFDDAGRDLKLTQPRDHVGAGDGVGAAVDDGQWYRAVLQRADPALTVFAALDHVADQPRQREAPVVAAHQLPHRVQLGFGRLRVTGYCPQVGAQLGAAGQAGDQRPQRRQQQFLQQHRPVRLGEEAAVEQDDPAQLDRQPAVNGARNEFLRHRIAQVMRQHGTFAHTRLGQRGEEEVGLFAHRVAVPARLGGEAQA